MMKHEIERAVGPAALTAGLYNGDVDVRQRPGPDAPQPPLTSPANSAAAESSDDVPGFRCGVCGGPTPDPEGLKCRNGCSDDCDGNCPGCEHSPCPRRAAAPARQAREDAGAFLRTCGAAAWFTWALAQFNLFETAPKPPPGLDVGGSRGWVMLFQRWCGGGGANTRARSVAAFLLHAYNPDIKVRGAEPIERSFGGMDDRNRRGVVAVLTHWRTF